MSYFTGWHESVIETNAKLDFIMQEYYHFQKMILAAIGYEEYKIGENFDRELIEKKFRELNKELYLSQLKIKNRISTASDKHFDRNRDKELNKQGGKQ
jgi:hypothetical protein